MSVRLCATTPQASIPTLLILSNSQPHTKPCTINNSQFHHIPYTKRPIIPPKPIMAPPLLQHRHQIIQELISRYTEELRKQGRLISSHNSAEMASSVPHSPPPVSNDNYEAPNSGLLSLYKILYSMEYRRNPIIASDDDDSTMHHDNGNEGRQECNLLEQEDPSSSSSNWEYPSGEEATNSHNTRRNHSANNASKAQQHPTSSMAASYGTASLESRILEFASLSDLPSEECILALSELAVVVRISQNSGNGSRYSSHHRSRAHDFQPRGGIFLPHAMKQLLLQNQFYLFIIIDKEPHLQSHAPVTLFFNGKPSHNFDSISSECVHQIALHLAELVQKEVNILAESLVSAVVSDLPVTTSEHPSITPYLHKYLNLMLQNSMIKSTHKEANELFREQKYSSALDLYSQCLRLCPIQHLRARSNRALCYLRMGLPKECIRDCKIVLDRMSAIDPQVLLFHDLLWKVHFRIGNGYFLLAKNIFRKLDYDPELESEIQVEIFKPNHHLELNPLIDSDIMSKEQGDAVQISELQKHSLRRKDRMLALQRCLALLHESIQHYYHAIESLPSNAKSSSQTFRLKSEMVAAVNIFLLVRKEPPVCCGCFTPTHGKPMHMHHIIPNCIIAHIMTKFPVHNEDTHQGLKDCISKGNIIFFCSECHQTISSIEEEFYNQVWKPYYAEESYSVNIHPDMQSNIRKMGACITLKHVLTRNLLYSGVTTDKRASITRLLEKMQMLIYSPSKTNSKFSPLLPPTGSGAKELKLLFHVQRAMDSPSLSTQFDVFGGALSRSYLSSVLNVDQVKEKDYEVIHTQILNFHFFASLDEMKMSSRLNEQMTLTATETWQAPVHHCHSFFRSYFNRMTRKLFGDQGEGMHFDEALFM